MASIEIAKKRPVSFTIICLLSLVMIVLTILIYWNFYHRNTQANEWRRTWFLIVIGLQAPIIAGVGLMYFLKRAGLWVFLSGKILFFTLPPLAGIDVMGLMTPIFFIESTTFFILFGKRVHYMH